MRKIEDDVLDNGGGSSDNNQGDGTPAPPVPQPKRTTKDKIFIAFGVILIASVVLKALGLY